MCLDADGTGRLLALLRDSIYASAGGRGFPVGQDFLWGVTEKLQNSSSAETLSLAPVN